MPSPKRTYDTPSAAPSLDVKEEQVEYGFIVKLQSLKLASNGRPFAFSGVTTHGGLILLECDFN